MYSNLLMVLNECSLPKYCIEPIAYCEGMKVCQKAGCMRTRRRKQAMKWERESVFRACSGVKEECDFGMLYYIYVQFVKYNNTL